MSMTVRAAKLTKDDYSTKLVYEKNGKLYMRTGADGFRKGQGAQTTLDGFSKWGFRRVVNPPTFRDSEEIRKNLKGFELRNDGKIEFSKPLL